MTSRQIEAIKVLRAQSMSYADIAARLGITEAEAFAIDERVQGFPKGATVADYDDLVKASEAAAAHEPDEVKIKENKRRKALLLSDKPIRQVAQWLGMDVQEAQRTRMQLRGTAAPAAASAPETPLEPAAPPAEDVDPLKSAAAQAMLLSDMPLAEVARSLGIEIHPARMERMRSRARAAREARKAAAEAAGVPLPKQKYTKRAKPATPVGADLRVRPGAAFGLGDPGEPAWPAKVKRKYTRRVPPASDLPAFVPFSEDMTEAEASAAGKIMAECEGIKNMLLAKNKAYGNSALNPMRVFSKSVLTTSCRGSSAGRRRVRTRCST